MPRNLVWGAAGIAALVVIGIGLNFSRAPARRRQSPSARPQAAPAAAVLRQHLLCL
jgi:hypothetical protein